MPAFAILAVLLVLLSAGAGLFATLAHVRNARLALAAHIKLVRRDGNAPDGQQAGAGGHAAPDMRAMLEARMRRWFAAGLPHTWGMRAGLIPLGLMSLGGGGAAWLLVRSGLHFSPWIGGAISLAAFFFAPRMWLKREQGRAGQQFLTLLPDTIDMVIRMLRAGLPVTAAIRAVGIEAAPPVDLVFARIADQMGIGISFEDALAQAAERIGLPDFRFFAIAISLQRATGGNLATTLTILSEIMRKRRAMRLKARAATGEVRMSAYILGAMPFLVIGALLVADPSYLAPLISDPRGNVILGIATGMLIAGFAIMRQMMRSVTNL